jgi:hypothetical protein
MKIRIHDEASNDLIEGFWFYEKQKIGLGAYFLDSLFSDIDSLHVYAGIHPVFFNEYHRLLSRRFPFTIYYRFVNDIVDVYAILDCRSDPAWIRKQL